MQKKEKIEKKEKEKQTAYKLFLTIRNHEIAKTRMKYCTNQ